jgi:hypothetical protein
MRADAQKLYVLVKTELKQFRLSESERSIWFLDFVQPLNKNKVEKSHV